ncbi:MAG TPA: PEP-CTERM sorting domain-containing protein, partial [Dehalococcoidia bacterium]|nr:PEP-CTERM sorting domain-containing protein [Dehalococcoidia bacterium]
TFDTSSWDNSGSLQVTVTPEPSTALLLGLGLASLAVRREK